MVNQKYKKYWWVLLILALILLVKCQGTNLNQSTIISSGSSSSGGSGGSSTGGTGTSGGSQVATCGLTGQSNAFKDNINSADNCYAAASQDCSNKGQVPETAYGYKLNGKCCTWKCVTLPPATCQDTDNGLDFSVKGVCTSTNSVMTYEDYCWTGNTEVYEFSCNPNTKDCDGIKSPCEGICSQGRCLPTSHCNSGCTSVQGNYIGGLCASYNPNGAQGMSQRCIQVGGTYVADMQVCGSDEICCCVSN